MYMPRYSEAVRKFLGLSIAFCVLALAALFAQITPDEPRPEPIAQTTTTAASPTVLNPTELAGLQSQGTAQVVAEGLSIPWEVAFLPDGSMLVTERPGRLLKIAADRTVIPIEGVHHIGEGGLLGLALHPDFSRTQWLYLYLTTRTEAGIINRVERYRLQGTQLADRKVIIDGIPGAQLHDGGRIAFGPDGYLYIATGDAGRGENAPDRNSLAGKILRLTDDGALPPDNPFGTAVYSLGHRNIQGLAWDRESRLWATEHGRSGVRSGFDEINLITPGSNYGWPTIQGDETRPGLTAPIIHSGPDTTWAPAGAAILGERLFFTGLRGESLYEATLAGASIERVRAHLAGVYGRLRTAVVGPDGWLYLATSNTDGRGRPRAGDDKIIKIDPATLP